jgi:hypothetical protein
MQFDPSDSNHVARGIPWGQWIRWALFVVAIVIILMIALVGVSPKRDSGGAELPLGRIDPSSARSGLWASSATPRD